MRRPWPTGGCRAKNKQTDKNAKYIDERTNVKKINTLNFQIIIELIYLFTLTQIHSKKYQ
jgi:hypothetical protein